LVSEEPTRGQPGDSILYADEEDMREAAENFRQYLAILQEWDEKEKAVHDDRPFDRQTIDGA